MVHVALRSSEIDCNSVWCLGMSSSTHTRVRGLHRQQHPKLNTPNPHGRVIHSAMMVWISQIPRPLMRRLRGYRQIAQFQHATVYVSHRNEYQRDSLVGGMHGDLASEPYSV